MKTPKPSKDSINQIGGLSVLLPVLRLLQQFPSCNSLNDEAESTVNQTSSPTKFELPPLCVSVDLLLTPNEQEDLLEPALRRYQFQLEKLDYIWERQLESNRRHTAPLLQCDQSEDGNNFTLPAKRQFQSLDPVESHLSSSSLFGVVLVHEYGFTYSPQLKTGSAPVISSIGTWFLLVRNLIATSPVNRKQLCRPKMLQALEYLLSKVNPLRLDAAVVAACHSLVLHTTCFHNRSSPNATEAAKELFTGCISDRASTDLSIDGSTLFLRKLFLNCHLWSHANPVARLEHIQHVILLARQHSRLFRRLLPVKYILEVMDHYYDVSENDSHSVISPLSMSASEESLLFHDYQSTTDIQHLENIVIRRVRYHFGELLEIILDRFVTLDDVKEIFMFLCDSSSINVINEVLEMLLRIVDHPKLNDRLFNFLYEPGTAINLYTFMLRPLGNIGLQAKKNALQLLCKLITNTRISDAHKVQILLEPLGGLTGFLAHHDQLLPLLQDADCVGLFLQIFKTIRGRDLPGLLKFIELLRHSDMHLRIRFLEWLSTLLEDTPTLSVAETVAHQIVRIPAFFEPLILLLVRTARDIPVKRSRVSTSCFGLSNHRPSSQYVRTPSPASPTTRIMNQSEVTKAGMHNTPEFSISNVLEPTSATNFFLSTTKPVSTPETKTAIRFPLEYDDDSPTSPIPVSSMIAQTSTTICTPLFSPQTSPTLCNQSSTDEAHCIRLADFVLRVLHQLLWQGCGLNKWFSLFAVQEESPWAHYEQVFAFLSATNVNYMFIMPYFWLVQRLLEHIIESVQSELGDVLNRLSITGNTEAVRQFCFPLIRLVVDVTCNHPRHVDDDYRVELLDAVTTLTQEILIVWDLARSWEEMEAVLLHMLFVWIFEGSGSRLTKIVPTVFARLRYMVYQLKNRIVFRKAAFILYRLNKILTYWTEIAELESIANWNPRSSVDPEKVGKISSVTQGPSDFPQICFSFSNAEIEAEIRDHQSTECSMETPASQLIDHLSPIVGYVLVEFGDVLQLSLYTPHLFLDSKDIVEEFRAYRESYQDEWDTYLNDKLRPAVEDYTAEYIITVASEQSLARAIANDELIKARRQRRQREGQMTKHVSTTLPIFQECQPSTEVKRPIWRSLMTSDLSSTSLSLRGSMSTLIKMESSSGNRISESALVQSTATAKADNGKCAQKALRRAERRAQRDAWFAMLHRLTSVSPCAPWFTGFIEVYHWRLTHLETASRMRPKLEPNTVFDSHLNASAERDGLTMEEILMRTHYTIHPRSGAHFLRASKKILTDFNASPESTEESRSAVGRCGSRCPRMSVVSCSLSDHEQMGQLLARYAIPDRELGEDMVAENEWISAACPIVCDEPKQDSFFDNTNSAIAAGRTSHLVLDVFDEDSTARGRRKAAIYQQPNKLSALKLSSGVSELRASPFNRHLDSDALSSELLQRHSMSVTSLVRTQVPSVSPSPVKTTATGSTAPVEKHVVLSIRAQMITPLDVVEGTFTLTHTRVIFIGSPSACTKSHIVWQVNTPTGNTLVAVASDTTPVCESSQTTMMPSPIRYTWPLAKIHQVHLRRYNLRRSAIEIFLVDNRNYFFNFDVKVRNTVFCRLVSLRLPKANYANGRSPSELFKHSGLTKVSLLDKTLRIISAIYYDYRSSLG
ncbi:hypothetical protein PHET_06862 [Paragonimus heterotremus]|uniref:BEACH-type PH domain-containing protein n=1 Tax=Paragonimus heterotremus TaxID=100268 RepID=A0A8J4T705_9TREM|nr:hypothetical protein PHET_06862 [Paragonimus heterotremus]